MWPVVYRILFPGVTLVVLSGMFSFFEFHAYKKKKRKKRNKSKRNTSLVWLIVSLFSLFYTTYCSMDLILKDYIIQQGTYMYYNRGREVYIQKVFFSVNDSKEFCYTFTNVSKNMKPGKQYKIVYAKRTLMLISIEENNTEVVKP